MNIPMLQTFGHSELGKDRLTQVRAAASASPKLRLSKTWLTLKKTEPHYGSTSANLTNGARADERLSHRSALWWISKVDLRIVQSQRRFSSILPSCSFDVYCWLLASTRQIYRAISSNSCYCHAFLIYRSVAKVVLVTIADPRRPKASLGNARV
jgi:hypothetical protein